MALPTGHLLAVPRPSNNLKQHASFSGWPPARAERQSRKCAACLPRPRAAAAPCTAQNRHSAHTPWPHTPWPHAQRSTQSQPPPLAGGYKAQLARSGRTGMCAAYLTAGLKPGSISDSAALAAAIGSHCTASVHASLRASSGCHCSLGAHRAAPYLGRHIQACSRAYMYQQASWTMPPPAGSCVSASSLALATWQDARRSQK